MAYSATVVTDYIQANLLDTGGAVWSDALICSAVTEAQNLIVLLRPDANAVFAQFSLEGTAKQVIPTGGVRLIDVIKNSDGDAVQRMSREKITELLPGWASESGSAVEFFMFDAENPTVFWVYPTIESEGNVDIVYSKSPDEFTTDSTGLGVPDVYIAAIYEYVFYRCLSMEGKGQDITKATSHLSAFYQAINVKTQSDSLLAQVQGGA